MKGYLTGVTWASLCTCLLRMTSQCLILSLLLKTIVHWSKGMHLTLRSSASRIQFTVRLVPEKRVSCSPCLCRERELEFKTYKLTPCQAGTRLKPSLLVSKNLTPLLLLVPKSTLELLWSIEHLPSHSKYL
jgi:hypothetical protein